MNCHHQWWFIMGGWLEPSARVWRVTRAILVLASPSYIARSVPHLNRKLYISCQTLSFSAKVEEWRLTHQMFVDQLQFCLVATHRSTSRVNSSLKKKIFEEMRTKTAPLPDWGDVRKFPCVRVSGGGELGWVQGEKRVQDDGGWGRLVVFTLYQAFNWLNCIRRFGPSTVLYDQPRLEALWSWEKHAEWARSAERRREKRSNHEMLQCNDCSVSDVLFWARFYSERQFYRLSSVEMSHHRQL